MLTRSCRRIHHYKVKLSALGLYQVLLWSVLELGQTLYTKGDAASLANMDRQIYRLIGKATTLAA